MVIALELKEGTVIRIEGKIYKFLEVDSKAGAAKSGGVVKAKCAASLATACGNRTSALNVKPRRPSSHSGTLP